MASRSPNPVRGTARLIITLLFPVALAGCAGSSPSDDITPPHLRALEQDVFRLVNAHRDSLGLPALEWDERVLHVAREHSRDMAEGRVPFGHRRFLRRVRGLAIALPFAVAGENVAFNQGVDDPAVDALRGWLDSPGHRRNIEGDYDRSAVGIAEDPDGVLFYTQVFVRSN